MTNFSDRRIKTGSDPRRLPDYAALRNELAKLSHPARPDVNWQSVEKRCDALFEQNGVELQSAAWYTLARTHLAGLSGLNEGLSLLETLITHQWDALWPQPVTVRMEILCSLSQRMQQLLRTFSPSDSDYSALNLAEQQLTRLISALQRRELTPLSPLNALLSLIHHSAVRLEKSDSAAAPVVENDPDVVLTSTGISAAPSPETSRSANEVKWIYLVPPEPQPATNPQLPPPAAATLWQPFALGMLAMLVLASVALWSWNLFQRPDPLQTPLASSLSALPSVLSPMQLEALRQQGPLSDALFTATQQQLTRLSQLPSDWATDYSRQLVKQAQVLWPEKSRQLTQQWQQQVNAAALPADTMNGWHQGMTELQTLADKLNALDEKRGRYLTVSELKSAVFSMMTHFRQTIPVEEQLRLIRQLPDDSPARQQQIEQAGQHLRAQAYALMNEKEKETTAASF